MTYSIDLIFDNTIVSGQIYVSAIFAKARFLMIDTVDFPLEEKLDLGFSLNVTIPTPTRLVTKNIALLPETVVGVFDTFYLVPIPLEFSESQFNMQVIVSFGDDADNTLLRIYAMSSDFTEEDIRDRFDEILEELEAIRELQNFDVAEDVGQIANSVQNNIALGVLSTSLIPVTGGVSSTALPPLGIGTTALTGLLLPGL